METLIKILSTSILTGLVASGVTVWITRKNLKTTNYIETITSERIKWIQVVRNDFNDLISSILIHLNNTEYLDNLKDEKIRQDRTEHIVGAYRQYTDEGLQEYSKLNRNILNVENAISKTLTHSEIASKALLIKLKLNPNEDIDIIKDLDKIVDFFSDYSKIMKEFDINLKLTVEKTQNLLKREWDKVKIEVQKK